jgi:uncharacterized membrane protein YtjA (UPF0391 family)
LSYDKLPIWPTPRRVRDRSPRADANPRLEPVPRDGLATSKPEPSMLHYAIVFFVIALIAALLGFGGIASGAVGIAKILFGVFLVLAIATFLFGLIRKG